MLALLLLVPLNLRSAIQLEKLSFLTLVASRFLNPQVHFNSLSSSILNQPSSVLDPQSSIRSSFLSYQSSTASHSWSPNIVAVVCTQGAGFSALHLQTVLLACSGLASFMPPSPRFPQVTGPLPSAGHWRHDRISGFTHYSLSKREQQSPSLAGLLGFGSSLATVELGLLGFSTQRVNNETALNLTRCPPGLLSAPGSSQLEPALER